MPPQSTTPERPASPQTDRTTITRIPEKGSQDRAQLDALLDAAQIGHFAFAADHGPVIIPTAIVRVGDDVVAHGSTGSRWMRALASGVPVALAVTMVDGLVVARSAFESSMHYRSAVLFGSCEIVDDREQKLAVLDVLTDGLLPGRVAEVRRPTKKELAATLMLRLPIVEWSLKISDGWPEDPDDDIAGDAWAGVVPLIGVYRPALAAPDLRDGIDVPASVRRLVAGPNS